MESFQFGFQDIFNQVYKHLMTQKIACQDSQGFKDFINESGNRCALGCLMSEKEANLYRGTSPQCIGGWESLDSEKRLFLLMLVDVHDDLDPLDWKEGLFEIARKFNLDIPS